MKVLFVARGNKKDYLINPGTVVNNQAESLIKNGVDVTFFLIKGKGFSSYIFSIPMLCKKIKLNNYNIIHSHYSLSSFVVTLALLFAGRNRKPHVVSLMGSDTKLPGLNKVFIKLLSKHSWHKTIVKSSLMAYELAIKNVEIIPNGVDLFNIKYKPNKKKPNRKERVILFASDPQRESKNFSLSKEAYGLLNDTNINLQVVFNVSHGKIIHEINSADVVLLTSKWEGSPNIVKEAMACNRPVVSTNVGDIQWLFGGEPGYFITSFNPEDVAEKIQKALKFAEEYGHTNGRERIVKLGLDSETIARRIISVYKAVLSNGK